MASKVDDLLAWCRGFRATNDLGRRGEDIAARELKRLGYQILERRWRTRFGEIDLVARHEGMLVIVEVKARSREDYGRPADAVGQAKQKRLVRLAKAYLRARRLGATTVRFDVVGVRLPPGGKPRVDVVQNAFGE